MIKLKLYTVTFNDGGWHTSLPKFTIPAESKELALKEARETNTLYKDWDGWAVEFTIDGYVIEVYDKRTYNREKNLDNLEIK